MEHDFVKSSPSIRPARDADGPAVASLIAAVFSEYEGCVFDWSEFPELRAPAAAFAARGGMMWVAARDEAVVGCGAVAPAADAQTFELFKFYVAKTERGSGLAQRLFETALSFARDRGARRIVLWSDTRFLAGHRFYEKHGFARGPEKRFLADLSDSWEYSFSRNLDASGSGNIP